MTQKQFEELVRKGIITHTGLTEKLSDPEFDIDKYITQTGILRSIKEDLKIDTPAEVLDVILAGGNVKIDADITIAEGTSLKFSTDTQLDLNGKSITGTVANIDKTNHDGDIVRISGTKSSIKNGSLIDNHVWDGKSTPAAVIFVENGAEVELDNVQVSGIYPLWVKGDGSTVTIKSGEFKSTDSQTLYVQGQSKIIIEGGTFEAPDYKGKNYCLNVKDDQFLKGKNAVDYIEVRGGTFKGFNPAANAENPVSSFVAEGYESVEVTPGVFVVQAIIN